MMLLIAAMQDECDGPSVCEYTPQGHDGTLTCCGGLGLTWPVKTCIVVHNFVEHYLEIASTQTTRCQTPLMVATSSIPLISH